MSTAVAGEDFAEKKLIFYCKLAHYQKFAYLCRANPGLRVNFIN